MLAGATYRNGKDIPLTRWDPAALPETGNDDCPLTGQMAAVTQTHSIGLLIGTNNDGGNVFRLPRRDYNAFADNMALWALYEGHCESALPYLQGKIIAQELCRLDLNRNFATVVDVNSTQANPVLMCARAALARHRSTDLPTR